MKNLLLKSIIVSIFFLFTVASLGADFVIVYFHDGTHKRFFLNEVKEIKNSKIDLDNITHSDYRTQIIKTKEGTYLQDISQIDSVVFSQEEVHFPKTEEEIEATIDRSHDIAVRMNEIVDSLKAAGIYNPMTITKEFSKIPDIIDAEIDESNSCITLLRSDSIYHDYIIDYWSISNSSDHINMSPRYKKAPLSSSRYYPHMNQVYITSEHNNEENKLVKEIKKVLILAPFEELYSIYDLESFCYSIKKNLNVDPHLFKGELADITKFKGEFLDNFDLIIFMTHGGRSSVGTRLLSGSSMYKSKNYWKKAVKDGVIPELRTGTPEGYEEDFLEMSPKFLTNASFDNSIVLAFACSSADRSFASPSMMSTFLDKGASYYCGFSNTSNEIVIGQFGQKGAQLAFACLSLQDAFDYLKTNDLAIDVNHNWIQYLWTYDETTTQEKIDHFNLDLFDYEAKNDYCYMKSPFPYSLNAYQNNHSVSLSWLSDLTEETLQYYTPDFEKEEFTTPEQTFKIRYDVYFNAELIASNLYDKEMMWDDVSKNNVWYVIAKILNSSTGETIATYKSEEVHFTIDYPALTLSTNEVSLKVGESSTIDITAGSGSYSIEKIEPTGVVTGSIIETHISIEAIATGTATITIKDNKSGQMATIEVTVWDHLSFAISGNVDLKVGESSIVDITSGSGTYSIEKIEPAGVVTASISENHISIEALTAGTAIISIKDDKSGETATIEVTVTENSGPFSYLTCPDDQHPHLIDLGLPSGTKWACCNVDSDPTKQSPTNYGSYYAWGEVEEKDYYDWSTYIHCDGDESTCHDLGSDIAGTEYDVARVKWGDSWVMPSLDQIKELLDNCPSQWTTVGGINGRSFTGLNGGTVFMPAAGFHYKQGHRYNIDGAYWSSSSMENFYTSVLGYADILSFSSHEAVQGPNYVYFGFTVRPVYVDDVVNKSHLQLSTTTLTLTTGHQGTVEVVSGSGSFDAVSNANDVASVIVDRAKLIIKAMAPGSATITVKDNQTQERAKIEVTVNEIPLSYLTCPDDHHPHLIDLGLPSGTKWACCNVDSDPMKQSPTNYGGYYAWGEAEEKDFYDWSTYIHCNGSNNTCHDLGSDITGTGYDVAHYQWGDSWVMPSIDQIKELLDNCTYTWTTLNGVNGGQFSGSNGGIIFLPAASFRWKDRPAETGSYGYYWSSTQLPSYSGFANDLYFDSVYPDDASWGRSDRYHGESVRPVWVP